MMTTTTDKATPRPWYEADDLEVVTRQGFTIASILHDDGFVTNEQASADRALIVKAVNAHDALMGWAEAYRDHLAGVHGKCDMDDDEHCRAEEYGDGNVGEHEDYRQVSADLKQVYNAAKAKGA